MTDDTTKYRHHRGGLAESMATVRDVTSRENIRAAVLECPFYPDFAVADIDVRPYGFDKRIGWDTHVVTVRGAVVGFTDGPLV